MLRVGKAKDYYAVSCENIHLFWTQDLQVKTYLLTISSQLIHFGLEKYFYSRFLSSLLKIILGLLVDLFKITLYFSFLNGMVKHVGFPKMLTNSPFSK